MKTLFQYLAASVVMTVLVRGNMAAEPDVSSDVVTGHVFDAKSGPAEGATVAVFAQGSFTPPIRVTADKTGKFSARLPHGTGKTTVIAWNDEAMSPQRFVEPGEPAVLLLREKCTGRVTGRVVDLDGNPIANASVYWLVPGDPAHFGNVPSMTRTDALGDYEFPRMWADRTLTFECFAKGYGTARHIRQVVQEGDLLQLHFALPPASQSLAGTLVDKVGVPMSGVLVRVGGRGQPPRAVETDVRGRFLVEKLVEGKASLEIALEEGVLKSELKTWVDVGSRELKLRMPPLSAEFTGRVVDSLGEPVSGLYVSCPERDRGSSLSKDGTFKFHEMEKGWFTLEVEITASTLGDRKVLARQRFKAGARDVTMVLPAEDKKSPTFPAEPLNLAGRPAPAVEASSWINGKPVAVSGAGRVRILCFWELDSEASVRDLPVMQKVWEEGRDNGVDVITTTGGFHPAQELTEYVADKSLTFPVAVRGEESSAVFDYDVREFPNCVVIDREGKVVAKVSRIDLAARIATELVRKR